MILSPTWPARSTPDLPLATGALHLWRVCLDPAQSLDAILSHQASSLSEEEQHRARRYLRPQHGSLWAQSRHALRAILAHYTGQQAASLKFSLGEHDKPALRGAYDLVFNLSHSHEWALLGVMHGVDVLLGVDVERCDEKRDLHAIAARVFSRKEQRRLHDARDPAEARRRFYATWTQKEAYIKALGLGLSLPLEQFDVDDAHFALIAARHERALDVSAWHMVGGSLDDDYMFAVCADTPIEQVTSMSWTLAGLTPTSS